MSANKKEMKTFKSFEEKNSGEQSDLWADGREFPKSVEDLIERGAAAGVDRKSFFTLMGASISMLGLSACKEPVEKIIPYVDRPVDHVPGVAEYYATARVTSQGVTPILVKTREGKPIKIEGLDAHPVSRGGITADTIASIWDLYDPDRVKSPLKKSGNSFAEIKWDEALAQAAVALKGNTRILSLPSYSPAESEARARLAKSTKAKLVVYDNTGTVAEIIEGENKSYRTPIVPQYRFDKADLILSLEADFLGTWLSPEIFTKQFVSRRTPDSKIMNRLVVAETMMSVTGANADTRLAINAGSHVSLALGLANVLLPGSNKAGDGAVKAAVSAYTPAVVAAATGLKPEQIISLANELKAKKGKSLVVGGGPNARTEVAGQLQVAVNLLNSILGNDGTTVLSRAMNKKKSDLSTGADIHALIKDMNDGKVETLVLDRCNPVLEFPASAGFEAAAKKVKNIIYIGSHVNDSAQISTIILPVSHYLESWSDGESYGVYSIVQPVIRSLFDTRPVLDIYSQLSGSKEDAYALVKNSAKAYVRGNFTQTWDLTLSAGYVAFDAGVNSSPARNFSGAALAGFKAPKEAPKGFTLNIIQTVQMGDGSGANISFRQELPDPINKITWDNVANIAPADAKTMKISSGDMVKIKSGAAEIVLPAFVQPGMRKGNVAIALGYGHTKIGAVGAEVGQNALKLAGYANGNFVTSGLAVSLEKTGDCYKLANTQQHHELGVKRGLVRIATLDQFSQNPLAGHEHEEKMPGKGLYKKHTYEPNRWNLNIDLNKCTGCSACVVACYSENNIPAVGRDEVRIGREMSWLRIDRYYSYQTEAAEKEDADMINPDVFFQPLMCQHCENAPCENVCPVGATGHSTDGLNYMTYNRCIGTRYCANNCPYKVRRYNWFENWENKLKDPQQYALNPDVTVRSRGVIEKCSFCQQRISEKRQAAKVEGRPLKDGEIRTACQQSCPADAITFGNINDQSSQIYKKVKEDKRSYKILAQINVEPAVSYMVRIRNRSEKKG
jgi:Fe-S-cluster-containing dehydrogenase component/anaerobic selenocysteine-containing dehydrogenase